LFLFGLSHQWLRYTDETVDEHPVVHMQPSKLSSAGACQLVLASLLQRPDFRGSWLLAAIKRRVPGTASSSGKGCTF
jgi:hypothetical protein